MLPEWNGLLAPPLLLLIMLIVNNRAVMGEHAGGVLPNVWGWLTTVLLTVAAVGLLVTA